MDRLAALTAFVRAADGGSFSEAGRQLGITPSAVSKAIKQIEGGLGVSLFQRTSRSMTLTDEGQAFYETCKRVLLDLHDAEEAVAGASNEPVGRVHLDMPIAFGRMHVLPQLPAFRARFPKLALDVTLDDRVADVTDEGIDIAIRVGYLPDSRLIARKLCDQQMAICASPSYLEWKGAPDRLEDLEEHNCMAFKRPQYGRLVPWFIAGTGGDIEYAPKGDFNANNAEALRDAAISGLGIVQLPRYIVGAAIKDGRLKEVLPDVSANAEPIWVVVRDNAARLPKIKAVTGFLRELVEPVPPWDRASA